MQHQVPTHRRSLSLVFVSSVLLVCAFAIEATWAIKAPTPTLPPPMRLGRAVLSPEKSEYENQGRVITSEEQLQKVLAEFPRVLVHLHAPWSVPGVASLENSIKLANDLCPSCKDDDAHPTLNEDGILLVRLDCRAARLTCMNLNHTTFSPYDLYPAFILFWDDTSSSSEGVIKRVEHYPHLHERPLHVDSIKRWLKSRLSKPFVHELKSLEEYKELIAPSDDALESQTVVAFISNDASQVQRFKDAANNIRFEGWVFGYITDEELIKEIGEEPNRIKLYFNSTASDEHYSLDQGQITTETIKHFICSYGYPSVSQFGIRVHRRFLECSEMPWVIFLLSKDPWYNDQLAEMTMLTEITPNYAGKLQFAYQQTPHVWQDFATFVGASGFMFPGSVIFLQKSPIVWEDKKILWDESLEITKESFTQWLDDFLVGNVVTWRRSLPLPKTNNGPLKTVVGFNYEKVVFDETKDVLLEYLLSPSKCRASWKMNTIMKEIGNAFDKTSVIIAQTNGEHNAFPEGTPVVESFPTLYFFPANNKASPIEFTGTPSAREIGKFILKHATTPIEVDVNSLSKTTIFDIKEEIGAPAEKDIKQYTEDDIKNINRQPQKAPRIPKDHPMYHYSQQVHHHDHDEDGGHHHHHDHPHNGAEEEEEFVVLGSESVHQTVFTTAQSNENHEHSTHHEKERHGHYEDEKAHKHHEHDKHSKHQGEERHGHSQDHYEHHKSYEEVLKHRHGHYQDEAEHKHIDHEQEYETQREYEHEHQHAHEEEHIHQHDSKHQHEHDDHHHDHKHAHGEHHHHHHDDDDD